MSVVLSWQQNNRKYRTHRLTKKNSTDLEIENSYAEFAQYTREQVEARTKSGVDTVLSTALDGMNSAIEEPSPTQAQRSLSLNDITVPEEQKRELKEAFGMFETRKGKMSAKDLGPLLRCLGLNPSERDLEEARHELDVSAKGRISYADVERYVVTHGDVYAEEMEDILEAFRVLDKCGNGKISVTDFRRCMTTMGDRMSVDEVEEIIKYAKSDGFIEYEDLLRQLSESTK